MTVGVPMLIDASTMMFDVLQQDPYTPETQAALERVRGMLVSISDADVAVKHGQRSLHLHWKWRLWKVNGYQNI